MAFSGQRYFFGIDGNLLRHEYRSFQMNTQHLYKLYELIITLELCVLQ